MLQRSCREIDDDARFFRRDEIFSAIFRRRGTFGECPTALIYPPILASSRTLKVFLGTYKEYEFKAYFCALEHSWCTAPDNSKNR